MSDDNPPAQRQVVVLRAGPPKRRGVVIDGVVGIVGVALLVAAFALGDILPEDEIPPKQFLPEFERQAPEAGTVVLTDPAWPGEEGGGTMRPSLRYEDPLPEGDVREIRVDVPHDNVFNWVISLTIRNGDDIVTSLPDRFDVDLVAPNGTVYTAVEGFIETRRARESMPDPTTPGSIDTEFYESPFVSQNVTFRLPAIPNADFITSNATGFDATDALRIASDLYTRPTAGAWTFRITMVEAGGCPEPGTSPDQIRRAATCLEETEQTGEDPGNPLTVSGVRYDYYTIHVPDPDEPGEGTLQ